MIHQAQLQIQCNGRGTYNITREVEQIVKDSGIEVGICHVFTHHTSASLTLCENADPAVRRDLETFMSRLIPDGDPIYEHSMEGPDDMPAHIRAILTNMDLTLPVTQGLCARGTWQGIYLWEHRTGKQRRSVTVTVQGEAR
ncbi:secondary thiamine-phosphate synthase enzyme YjbQ [Sedimenticola selenatireducens]|jgi:secondary thiamine-phosphate synthase enzyme|uniref:YjbQ family protein n=1 Tax=Sedimenticola selenatireducens TaxID=191960 RepID=A0A558DZJ3_9GAMM|nr:secondary thiamine-phosphate synthase enzyme YjbQ [Sedimenticola selenatireducens]TVO71928.1 YjbQ family protein [Sedimenticola selenatireducens]TVT66308.1 MAG: YjbQ family protein [Sedimenticola selenatireducens]